jgi:hypothetical protein
MLVVLVAHAYNVGTIWMVQVSWRPWARVGRAEFPRYHRAGWEGPGGIQPVVFPSAILASLPLYQRLMRTHWARVGLITLSAAVQFWMTLRSVALARTPLASTRPRAPFAARRTSAL